MTMMCDGQTDGLTDPRNKHESYPLGSILISAQYEFRLWMEEDMDWKGGSGEARGKDVEG